jgi:hypothetical protein
LYGPWVILLVIIVAIVVGAVLFSRNYLAQRRLLQAAADRRYGNELTDAATKLYLDEAATILNDIVSSSTDDVYLQMALGACWQNAEGFLARLENRKPRKVDATTLNNHTKRTQEDHQLRRMQG